MEMNEITRLIVVNDELKDALKGFVNEIIEHNDVPWFMMEDAIASAQEYVAEKAKKELEDAKMALTEHYAALAAEAEVPQEEGERPVTEDSAAIEQE